MKEAATSFIFYTAYKEKFRRLTDAQLGALVRIMCDYKETGDAPEITDAAIAFAFDVVKYDMDRNAEKYDATVKARKEAGAKGGARSKPKQTEANEANAIFVNQNKQTEANEAKQADNDNVNENENENENVNDNENVKSAPTPTHNPEEKQLYGLYHNVRLTDGELQAMMDTYPDDYRDMIENLSAYMKSKGRYYDDHFATMMRWKRQDGEKAKTPAPPPKHGTKEELAQFYQMVDDWATREEATGGE